MVEAARDQCEVTLQTHSEATPETIKKMVEAFAAYKVTPEQLQKRLGRRLDSINAANVVQLKKIYQSLKDGMSKPEDWFEQTTPGVAEINERLAGKKPETVDKVTGEILATDDAQGATLAPSESQGPPHADWLSAIEACSTVADLARLMKEMPGDVKKALGAELRQRQDEIKARKPS